MNATLLLLAGQILAECSGSVQHCGRFYRTFGQHRLHIGTARRLCGARTGREHGYQHARAFTGKPLSNFRLTWTTCLTRVCIHLKAVLPAPGPSHSSASSCALTACRDTSAPAKAPAPTPSPAPSRSTASDQLQSTLVELIMEAPQYGELRKN